MKRKIEINKNLIPVQSKEASKILNGTVIKGTSLFEKNEINMDLNKR